MTTELFFADSLISALNEYDILTEEIEKINLKKEEIRENIKKWLVINNISEFETKIKNDKLYRISKAIQLRKSPNYEYLESVLKPDEMVNAINLTEYETLTIKEVKHRKQKTINGYSVPKAPKAE